MMQPDSPEAIQLKEKIALCSEFTRNERDLLLEAVNLGDYRSIRRQYPSHHGPGSSVWATAAWAVLDKISPNAMSINVRYLLGGMIAGALQEMFEAGKRSKS